MEQTMGKSMTSPQILAYFRELMDSGQYWDLPDELVLQMSTFAALVNQKRWAQAKPLGQELYAAAQKDIEARQKAEQAAHELRVQAERLTTEACNKRASLLEAFKAARQDAPSVRNLQRAMIAGQYERAIEIASSVIRRCMEFEATREKKPTMSTAEIRAAKRVRFQQGLEGVRESFQRHEIILLQQEYQQELEQARRQQAQA